MFRRSGTTEIQRGPLKIRKWPIGVGTREPGGAPAADPRADGQMNSMAFHARVRWLDEGEKGHRETILETRAAEKRLQTAGREGYSLY
jgi:hypothetical protein